MKYYLDARKMQTKDEAHEYLKYRMDFPEYYGKNLDALYDLLSEQDGVEVEIINVDDENKYIKQVAKVMKAAGVLVKG